MNNFLQKFEKEQIQKLTSNKSIPAFRPGDTLKVTLKIVEGERSRLQAFEGICIARKNNSINSKFTVRKISHGEGVERVFPLFSPIINKIEVIRKGDVRRAKLYYLRSRTGKKARISDLDRGDEADQYAISVNNASPSAEENDKNKNRDKIKNSTINDENIKETKTEAKTEEESVKAEEQIHQNNSEVKSESAASNADKTDDESKS